ncbi:hypothetical protein A2U01_0067494, partial [Trifolium medium]|nr:hypothetical protein [Trifolium medium]
MLPVVFGSRSLCFSDAPGLLRSAGFNASGLPPPSATVMLERAFMLADLFRELL